MKHITPYKLFENNDKSSERKEYVKYLHDIFQELKDSDIEVDIFDNGRYIWVSLSKGFPQKESVLNFNQVKEYILSAVDYMESVGYNNEILIRDDKTESAFDFLTPSYVKLCKYMDNGGIVDIVKIRFYKELNKHQKVDESNRYPSEEVAYINDILLELNHERCS